ncbi:hypothetical protein LshimejAT787_0904870 [Lyophyllum shimeji]|uniref:Uncharacterized protein n=1 Tax=Lyophyllum shimeji TaxID=47721 RepID=A0A9P3PR99_LYOSH|nr:hypothetical protein LshimejAT787_0904870 [Lyophyllum shimeji]
MCDHICNSISVATTSPIRRYDSRLVPAVAGGQIRPCSGCLEVISSLHSSTMRAEPFNPIVSPLSLRSRSPVLLLTTSLGQLYLFGGFKRHTQPHRPFTLQEREHESTDAISISQQDTSEVTFWEFSAHLGRQHGHAPLAFRSLKRNPSSLIDLIDLSEVNRTGV